MHGLTNLKICNCLFSSVLFYFVLHKNININFKYTVEPGYSNVGLCHASSTPPDIVIMYSFLTVNHNSWLLRTAVIYGGTKHSSL